MSYIKKQRRPAPDFDHPERLPTEVQPPVIELNALKRLMRQYTQLLTDLPSFKPLQTCLDAIDANLAEILYWIAQYLDEDADLDLVSLKSELAHLTAEALSDTLDICPRTLSLLPANASEHERLLHHDANALMANMWQDIRDQGYRLHRVLVGDQAPGRTA